MFAKFRKLEPARPDTPAPAPVPDVRVGAPQEAETSVDDGTSQPQ